MISLKQLLEQLFPVTLALVGKDFFAQCCRQFIQQAPLMEPHLNLYGGEFVTFLDAMKSLKTMPFVSQMAELEWHLDRIGHIHYQPKFNFEGLAQVDQEQHLNIRFSLATTCYLQTSNMDLVTLHQDLSSPKTHTVSANQEATRYQQRTYILLLQNQRGESALMALSHLQWTWLVGLQNGFTLAQVCNLENTEIEPLMAQITDWIALGIIDAFDHVS